MAMMAKMRSLAPAFIITVGVLFVLFMVVSDSNVLEALGGGTNNIGSINGEDITYQQFVQAVDQQLENQKQQTGEEIEQEEMDQFRDQVWESIVNQTLISQQIEKYDIGVSDEEIRGIILGPNPPQFIRQYFIDSTGRFNRQAYENALYDPENVEALIQTEELVRQQRLSEKLQSMLLASVTVSDGEIRREFIDRNMQLNTKYVLVDLYQFPDSLISVNEEDLEEYYNKNLDKYEIKPQRKLKFVLFANKATPDDTSRVEQELINIKNKLVDGSITFEEAVNTYSVQPYRKDTIKVTQFPPASVDLLGNKESGVIGPFESPQGYALYNIIGTIPSNETWVRAYHILVNQFESDERNKEEAMKIYNSLKEGSDFSRFAEEKSADTESAKRGGDLGWFGKGQMVPVFEKAAFNGQTGVVQQPVKSEYGYHIIKVTGKTSKKYIVERLVEPVEISPASIDANYNAAEDFAYLAKKNDFEKEAELLNYNVRETLPFYKEAVSVPGIGMSKSLVKFAFENDLNTISEVHKISNGYVVVKISEVIKEGVKPFEEVKDQIKPLVVKEKKYEKAKEKAEEIKSKINGDLDKAKSVYPKAVVDTTGRFSVNSTIPKVGVDYAFLGKAKEIETNKVSDPVKGNRGYYLIKVLYRTPFDSSAFAVQKNSIRDNLLQEKKNTFFNEWITELRKDAEIEDNRYLFYNR